MKFNKTMIKSLVTGFAAVALAACTANYEEINKNPYQPDEEDMRADDYLFGAMLLNLQDLMMPEQENFAQFADCLMPGGFSGYVADSNLGTSWSGRFATYNPSQGWLKVPFNDFYTKFYPNYFQLKQQSTDEVYLALADLFRVVVMQRVTDTYGPIPYSQVGVENSVNAPYDTQKAVYAAMFEQLDAVIATLNAHSTQTFPAGSDRIYSGNVGQWVSCAWSMSTPRWLRRRPRRL